MNAFSTLVAFLADVSKNSMPRLSANSYESNGIMGKTTNGEHWEGGGGEGGGVGGCMCFNGEWRWLWGLAVAVCWCTWDGGGRESRERGGMIRLFVEGLMKVKATHCKMQKL
jgi:hypothetical protein